MKTVCREQVTKTCVLTILLAAGVCAVMLIPSPGGQGGEPARQAYIPRYLFEKEIRGPTYHVVHRVLENDGYRSHVRTRGPQGQNTPHRKYLIRRRRAVQADQENLTGDQTGLEETGSVVAGSGMKIVPAYPRPYGPSRK